MSENKSSGPRISVFDIRNIVGALLTIYGIVLVVTSFTTSDAQRAKADGVNANLWVGLAMAVVGVLLIVWAVTRPIIVDEAQLEADKKAVDEAAGRPVDTSGSVD